MHWEKVWNDCVIKMVNAMSLTEA